MRGGLTVPMASDEWPLICCTLKMHEPSPVSRPVIVSRWDIEGMPDVRGENV